MSVRRRAKAARRRDREMRAAREADTPLTLGYQAVALLDIMGYRQALLSLSHPPPLPPLGTPEEAELKERTNRVVRIRRDVVGLLGDYMRSMDTDLVPPSNMNLTAEMKTIAATWRKFRIGAALFSDSIILNVPLKPAEGHALVMRALATMVIACGSTMILQLARGGDDLHETLPLRGAIDVDVSIEVPDRPIPGLSRNEPQLYSAALARAANAEKEAVFPRLVVTDRFREAIDTFAGSTPDSYDALANQALARRIRTMLAEDDYGGVKVWIVDYLGPGLREVVRTESLQEMVDRAWRFARAALDHWTRQGDQKLVGRYEYLVHYIRERLALWGVPPGA